MVVLFPCCSFQDIRCGDDNDRRLRGDDGDGVTFILLNCLIGSRIVMANMRMDFRTGIDIIGCIRGLCFISDGTVGKIMLIKSRGLGNLSIDDDRAVSNSMLVENGGRYGPEVRAFLYAFCEVVLGNSSWPRICCDSDGISNTVI